MIKEVLMNTGDGSFEKARNNPLAKLLFGQGLIGLNGDEWAHHRRIANQAFMIERVKVKSNAQTNQAFKMEFFL
jgi:cytochrome P450